MVDIMEISLTPCLVVRIVYQRRKNELINGSRNSLGWLCNRISLSTLARRINGIFGLFSEYIELDSINKVIK